MSVFDPHENFLSLNIVKITLLIGGMLFFASTFAILSSISLEFDFSEKGVNLLISTFKVPLGILTAIIPILMILTATHKSEQTKEQIRVATISNNLSSYFKHLEEFEKYMKKFDEQPKKYEHVTFKGTRGFHKALFPNAFDGDFSFNKNLIDETKYMIYQLIDTNSSYEPSHDGRYSPEIDVIGSVEKGLSSEITEVSFVPRDEVFITGLYGIYEIINSKYVESIYDFDKREVVINRYSKDYDEVAKILYLVLSFVPTLDLSFIPLKINLLKGLDSEEYKKKHRVKMQKMKVNYFPFGMVANVEFNK